MKKRIAYVVHSLNLGGTERLAADMAMAMRHQFDIRIICLDEPGIWAETVRKAGIPVMALYRQPGLDLRLPLMLARYARQNHIHLFHAHQCTPWFYAGLSRMIHPATKLLFEEHGRLYPEIENLQRRLFNRVVLQQLTHQAVAVSNDVKNRLFLYEGLDPEKIQVVYNGTRPVAAMGAEERQALRLRFGLKQSDFVAGFSGRLDPIKNLALIIDGYQRAKAKCPDLKILIIGDGPLHVELKEKIDHLKLRDHILLAGYHPDAAKLAAIMDVFLLVSFSEGTSMALLEAMSAGIPAIVTDVGGNPEIVVHNQTGWIIPSGDPIALAVALAEASKDKAKRQILGINAQNRYLEKFTFNGMIDQYNHIYNELLD